jgi:signal recognition particle subunit SEC65
MLQLFIDTLISEIVNESYYKVLGQAEIVWSDEKITYFIKKFAIIEKLAAKENFKFVNTKEVSMVYELIDHAIKFINERKASFTTNKDASLNILTTLLLRNQIVDKLKIHLMNLAEEEEYFYPNDAEETGIETGILSKNTSLQDYAKNINEKIKKKKSSNKDDETINPIL